MCFRAARAILRTDADAEDAAQEAVLRGWRSREACRDPDRYLAWLGQIARREALRLAAERRNTSELSDAHHVVDGKVFEELLLRLGLEPTLAELDADDRILLELRYRQDLSYGQLAARLGVPVGTAKVRLHRLQVRLRARLLEAEWLANPTTPG